jgi:hypothetical protein
MNRKPHFFRLLLLVASFLWLGVPSLLAQPAPIDFSQQIRPLLSDHCFQCHGPDAKSREAELRLDERTSALRTEKPVIVPGQSASSELWKRIIAEDPDIVMPPPATGRKLTADQKQLLRRWIDEGAVWGKHWAFAAPQVPAQPAVQHATWPLQTIDTFVLDRLERESLPTAAEASRLTLLRRVTLDLTGLPPTPEAAAHFLADKSPDAYERVVDRLLASPRFGERMVWDWLDAARYADTNGYQGDPTRSMWYWRDWAIAALNQNMPFDQFTVEQLSGYLLPQPSQSQLIATGFHRNHMINGEGGRIAEESRVDYVQDRVETTGTVWLGLTLNCCRCHDHKFDPVSQREYYQLSAFFNSIDETGAGREAGGLSNPVLVMSTPDQERRLDELRQAERAATANFERHKRDIPENILKILAIPAADRTPEQSQELAELSPETEAEYKAAQAKTDAAKKRRDQFEKGLPRTMVMRERSQPRETFVLVRGAYDQKADKVTHGVPSVLPALPADSPPDRMALARWLVAPEHPLTARVTVNRWWQTLFGIGLVRTAEDFGSQGELPSHPELLDWLACELRDRGWDGKRLLRQMVTSATYRQSSRVTSALVQRDPDNRLLARGPRYRLPSWMIRDQALAIGGLLVEQTGGPPVNGYQPEGIWEEATFGKITYEQAHGAALYRRSLYQFWRRIVGPTVFFDVASRQSCQVKVAQTNTPLHALVTLNDVTYVESARGLAERVLSDPASSDSQRIEMAFRACTLRTPTPGELEILLRRLSVLREDYGRDGDAARALITVGDSLPNSKLSPVELAAYQPGHAAPESRRNNYQGVMRDAHESAGGRSTHPAGTFGKLRARTGHVRIGRASGWRFARSCGCSTALRRAQRLAPSRPPSQTRHLSTSKRRPAPPRHV